MTLVMSYVILLTALLAACAVVLEGVRERTQSPRRWIWVASLGAALIATAFPMIWPATPVGERGPMATMGSAVLVSSVAPAPTVLTSSRAPAVDMLSVADAVLPFVWLVASALLLIVIGFGQWRLRRERARARPAQLAGHQALVSESIGPAVAGLRDPVVFVPRWVFALDEPSQRLLMAHEVEHVRARDTRMLLAGALSVALVPWNPVVWWIVRRLRLAIEQDCDARVLAANPGVRRYADLLLLAASRHGLATRLLAAHLGEHSSDLVRRIDTMTRRDTSWRRLVPSALVAGVLLAVACETPRPDPVAPIDVQRELPAPQPAPSYSEVAKSDSGGFSVRVYSSEGQELARYAGEIPVAHLPKDGVQSIKLDEYTCGDSECYKSRITLKPGYTLTYQETGKNKTSVAIEVPDIRISRASGETAVGRARFKTASNLVEVADTPHFHFDSRAVEQGVVRDKGLGEWPAWTKSKTDVPNVFLLGTLRTELRRIPADKVWTGDKSVFDEILPEDVIGLEMHFGYGGRCEPLGCPWVNVIIRPGREAAYKR